MVIKVILIAAVLAAAYLFIVQYRRAEKATRFADILLQNMEIIHAFISEATTKMSDPKLKQAFESDDEIGFFFKELEDIQGVLESFVHYEETVTDVE